MQANEFHCQCCGTTSAGPFLIAGEPSLPRCKNDDCSSQWWNRSIFDMCKSMAKVHAMTLGVEIK